ncbi:hypothetical protein [Desulfosarcina sp.]|uniref:hypothetical protein n=1 Tax=Desulfosarcina sp. TaxID=2027861 RepID=UPI0039707AA2
MDFHDPPPVFFGFEGDARKAGATHRKIIVIYTIAAAIAAVKTNPNFLLRHNPGQPMPSK